MKTVWIYDEGDTFKIFDSEDEAQTWLEHNDPEGVAFKRQLGDIGLIPGEEIDSSIEARDWSEPEPATSFRTIDGEPIYWRDARGVVHACEGADIHPDVRVF